MLDCSLEGIFSYTATVNSPPEVIGPVPEAIRVNFYVTGGRVEGPKLNGKILPVGGDWLTIRTDGVGILDARATFETEDGALIYTTYSGVLDLGEDGYHKFLRQEMPAYIQLRIAPRYYTAHHEYKWLNRVQCLGIGQADMERSEVHYDIYAVR
jgi:hypothetical protein